MAIDLGPHGVRVNTICPTFIETPMARRFLANKAVRSWLEPDQSRADRTGRGLEGAVVFLASDVPSLMTGSAMVVDGGWAAD
jgi:NAD(P)-dependent dehydrogenase (short-subunit alcohol dehydrogenase family)